MNLLMKVFLITLLYLEIFIKNIYALPLSIVVPVYNTALYLDRCINSILNQTFKDFELICVDDGSIDNSMEILEKFKMIDNRVKIIHFEKNKGASAARNAGIENSIGEFIGFVDSDDYIDERFYENLLQNSNDYDIVVGQFVLGTNNSKYYYQKKYKQHWSIYDSIWRKEFLNDNNIRYNEKLIKGNDYAFNVLAYKYNPKVLNLPDEGIYYYYKRRTGSLRNFSEGVLKIFDNIAYKKFKRKNKNLKNRKENL
ncbi:nucleotide-diphospho-sugar transferase [Neocallimastix lanati (nom. inval.)]|uniref:Nucleotide-diphospho-sugar transferase n=1 Tax=Neocallimastix californiae TaxID=1754190 RepID=A0A1Y1ZU40_9FUNG|nr:nucleotide-diphospho-sugar transferase [Neocallimastix sp. JGI-2020a]ORY13779.1 nucleotide-diphospho-sugar transferase [Neocallimastix californiae]|eukprot:ORY13779.1 nucleotide-diphospho-sugar transferase [Neocallimastix californiae]